MSRALITGGAGGIGWSLARQLHAQGCAVVVCDRVCALVILAHTGALSLLALIPALFGMGSIYFVAALAGGSLFTWTSIRLALRPNRSNALKNFLMSLLQLCLLLIGAIIDRAYFGAF